MVLVPSFQSQKQKNSFLGLGCSVSYRPVWSSENVAQKGKKRKISGPGVPPDFAKFLGLAVQKFVPMTLKEDRIVFRQLPTKLCQCELVCWDNQWNGKIFGQTPQNGLLMFVNSNQEPR
jgi:hypothetical protein